MQQAITASERKSTQRERIVQGMVDAANREGYAGANVAQVISRAGVSRPTFYEYFTDKDDCFLQVNREIAGRLPAQIRDAVGEAAPQDALAAAIRRLIERAEAEPAQAQFLANATMAGGPRALDERDRAIAEIEAIVERERARTPAHELSPDLPMRMLIGAVHWLLSPRLRRGERDLRQLTDEVLTWIKSYERPYGEHRWHALQAGPPLACSPYAAEFALHTPQPLHPGRSLLSKAEIVRNQRERIMYATAEVSARKGYTATTITDITAIARVDRRVFYTHFCDKQDAFLAVHELAIHQIMAVAARAFFSANGWPERIWQGILGATEFQATHPTISNMGYVEAYAVGAPAIQRVENSHTVFAIFLQEGAHHARQPPSDTAMQAITAAVFEIGYCQTREGKAAELPRYAHVAAYLALAPYLGPHKASEFIDRKLQATSSILK